MAKKCRPNNGKNKSGRKQQPGYKKELEEDFIQENRQPTPIPETPFAKIISTPQQQKEAETTHQNELYFPEFRISTFTSYTKSETGNSEVTIRTKAYPSSIYSLLIKRQENGLIYGIAKRSTEENRTVPIRDTVFKNLYENPEVLDDRAMQCELSAIEETVMSERKKIGSHLKMSVAESINKTHVTRTGKSRSGIELLTSTFNTKQSGVDVEIVYIGNTKQVLIKPKPQQGRKIRSLRVSQGNEHIDYRLKEFMDPEKDIQTASGDNVKKMYNTGWISGSRYAQKELQIVEQVLKKYEHNIGNFISKPLNLK